ncbi:MAG: hypothetical protein QOI20_3475, partial [Acidimicrobiaceae bacterium]|nr:hypothetical protein [Acidimicrobiaceae bacterium]
MGVGEGRTLSPSVVAEAHPRGTRFTLRHSAAALAFAADAIAHYGEPVGCQPERVRVRLS